MGELMSIDALLGKKLDIPSYQRPYKWTLRNIEDLLSDITNAIDDSGRYQSFKYRIGTIILHKNKNDVCEIVDGQQRIISLFLLKKYLEPETKCSISKMNFPNKTTQANLHNNYIFISEWFSLRSGDGFKGKFNKAFTDILEVVVIYVDTITQAFQLFDSQNTRGKALDPHDLLKAYHLREMKKYPYEMVHAVTKWEANDMNLIRDLFDLYLFPIRNWSHGIKSKPFTANEIDNYKGITESSKYNYARRASRAMPYFQIAEPFIAGNDFFEMVEHYMYLLVDIKSEIINNPSFTEIKKIICNGKTINTVEELDRVKYGSAGFGYVKNLFFCALLCYYDKFHNFDEMAVKKLFTWAFMLRVDMENLGFDSINKYATGDENSRYTNTKAMFSIIGFARLHNEISNLQIKVMRDNDGPAVGKWEKLYIGLKKMNGLGGVI